MQEPQQRPGGRLAGLRPRQVWGAGVLVAALGLIAIVVVAADGQPLSAPDSSTKLELGRAWELPVAVVGIVGFVVGLAVIVLGFRRQRLGKPVWRRRHTWLVWMAALVIGVFAVLLFRPDQAKQQRRSDADGGSGAQVEQVSRQQPPPPWAMLSLGGVVVVALAGAILLGRRMRRGTVPAEPELAGDALAVIERSLVELDESDDPRAAIIAAYARLLDAFAARGLERRPAETPVEHLHRGLAALPIRPEPAARLTSLFLEARFSTHPMGPQERDAARLAFREARDDLAGEPAPEAVTA